MKTQKTPMRKCIGCNTSKPKKELYMQIVTALVKENGIEMDPKELELKAEAFALAKGGRSARLAGQFADSLLTQEMGK